MPKMPTKMVTVNDKLIGELGDELMKTGVINHRTMVNINYGDLLIISALLYRQLLEQKIMVAQGPVGVEETEDHMKTMLGSFITEIQDQLEGFKNAAKVQPT